ncbi:MAG: helix-turn-helix domain-containing protein [Gemmatimonadales bacterium]|nr:helix-turn-helix domain-containing protein [Gemmatimonadales bacterium]
MTDQPVLKTPGELLQEARQAAGFELGLMAERTKIPLAILRSLELDEYHKVSGPLYVNSFLRTYANDLGLDTAQVMEAYRKFSGEVVLSGSGPDPEAVWVDEEVMISRVGPPWGMIGIGAGGVVVLVIVLLWLTNLRGCSAGDDDPMAESSKNHGSLLVEDQSPSPSLADEALPQEALPNEVVPDAEEVVSASPKELPVADPTDRVNEKATVTQVDQQGSVLPEALAGDAGVLFQDGTLWPLVLRILCREPVNAQVVRDGDRDFIEILWPATGKFYPDLPSEGIRQGHPYQTRKGLVIYWGARDQFSLKLGRTDGIEVSVNGEVRNIEDLLPGQELILFVLERDKNNGS